MLINKCSTNLARKSRYTIPVDDKSVFIEPALSQNRKLIDTNRERIKQYKFTICGLDYSCLRNQIRFEVIDKAKKYTKNLLRCWDESLKETQLIDDKSFNLETIPIILTGHAPAFYSPGIWIKNHLVDKLAKSHKGVGINLVIDNDTSRENFIFIPNLDTESPIIEDLKLVEITKGLAYEETILPSVLKTQRDHKCPDKEDIDNKKDNIPALIYHDIKKKCVSLLKDVTANETINNFMDLIIHSAKCTSNFGEQLTFARRRFEDGFDIKNLEIPISKICETEGFLIFFLAITIAHDRFANIYNSRVENYRKENRIRSRANPFPNLKIDNELTELPFWIWRSNRSRQKVYVRKDGYSCLEILTERSITQDLSESNKTPGEELICLEKISLEDNRRNLDKLKAICRDGYKIRPKALTNTLFSRLFFADVFIHGIGGAKYDIITDGIIKDFFGVTPPDYIAISATLYPPFNKFNVEDKSLLQLENELKQMRHNPDKYVPDESLDDQETKELILEKQELIDGKMKESKKHAKDKFLRIKEINVLLNDKIKQIFKKKESEINNLKNRLKYNSIINNRNYPFFIFPEGFIKEFYRNALSG